MAGEDLVLKISADTSAVASGLAPMTTALDTLEQNADAAGRQLSTLDGLKVAPAVDDTGLKSAATSLDALDQSASGVGDTLGELNKDKVSPPVDTTTMGKLEDAAKDAGTQLGELADPVTLTVRQQAIERAQERIEELKDEIAEDVEMGVDTKDALREMSTLERSVRELTEDPQEIDVEVNPDDADFAFESMAKLKRGVRGLTDAALELGDGVKAIPDLVSAGVGSFTTLNATVESFQQKQQAAGKAIGGFGSTLSGVTGFLAGPWGLGIAAGITLLGAFAGSMGEAEQATKDFADSLNYEAGALDRSNRQKAAKQLLDSGALDAAKKLGLSTDDLVTGLIEQKDVYDALTEAEYSKLFAANLAAKGMDENRKNVDTLVLGYRKLLPSMEDSADKQKTLNDAIGKSGDTTKAAAEGVGALADANTDAASSLRLHEEVWTSFSKDIHDAQSELDKLVEGLDLFNGRAATADEATASYEQSLDDLTAAIKENGKTTKDHGKTLDLTTKRVATIRPSSSRLRRTSPNSRRRAWTTWPPAESRRRRSWATTRHNANPL